MIASASQPVFHHFLKWRLGHEQNKDIDGGHRPCAVGRPLRWSAVSTATMQERGQGTRPSQAAGAGRYHALLIAVQNYRHPSVNSLDYPLADARRVRQVLTSDYNFDPQDVTLLGDPDRDAILTVLERLAEKLQPDDHLLIFYAGTAIGTNSDARVIGCPPTRSGTPRRLDIKQ